MKSFLMLLFFMWIALNAVAQRDLDSLKRLWESEAQYDTVRYEALYQLIKEGYLKQSPDSAIILAEKGKNYAQTQNDSMQLARFMKVEAIVLSNKGELTKALAINNQILEVLENANNQVAVEEAYERIGKIYFYQSEFDKALKYGLRKLAYEEKRNDPAALAMSYNNVGAIYKALEEYEKALDYYLKTLEVYSEIGEKSGVSTAYSNIATIYSAKKDNVKSMEFNKKSMKIREALNHKYTMVISYFNVALNYKALDSISEFSNDSLFEEKQTITNYRDNKVYNQEQALYYFKKATVTSQELGNDFLTAVCHLGLGELQYAQNNYNEAINNLKIGLDGVSKIGNKGYMSEASILLYNAYKAKGDHKKALEMYENYNELKDSISSEENLKGILEQEYQYNYQKQAAIDSIKHNEAQKLKEIELKKQTAELSNQHFKQYLLIGGLFVVVLFSIYFVRKNKEVREQKVEVEKQKEFAEEQHQIAESQKAILGKQHREITDSINYAQNLQQSVLPSKEAVYHNFRESFVLLKPKDVVSGDFYWTYKKGDLVYLAVVDCTGHGVPGAFMTIVANNLLNEIIQGAYNTPKEIVEE
ncbi:MAG: tetratricopeptide repeat protein, partial [Flavobacteriales bacterium]|nr:tetratricopeptide repeat protein [Flavobacteriales bacterium]